MWDISIGNLDLGFILDRICEAAQSRATNDSHFRLLQRLGELGPHIEGGLSGTLISIRVGYYVHGECV
jgi:hypothetical protein